MLLVSAIMHLYEGRSEAQVTQQAAFDEKKSNPRTVRDTLILYNCVQILSSWFASAVMQGNAQIGYCSTEVLHSNLIVEYLLLT